jgi:hypothetical protein
LSSLAVLRQQRRGLQSVLDTGEAAGAGARVERVDGAVERGEGVVIVGLMVGGALAATAPGRLEHGVASLARGEERGGVGEERAQVVVEEGDEGEDGGARWHRHWRRWHCNAAVT